MLTGFLGFWRVWHKSFNNKPNSPTESYTDMLKANVPVQQKGNTMKRAPKQKANISQAQSFPASKEPKFLKGNKKTLKRAKPTHSGNQKSEGEGAGFVREMLSEMVDGVLEFFN